MHRIPPKSKVVNRQKWSVTLNLTEYDVLEHHRISISEMLIPLLHLGPRFTSPKKVGSQRCKTSCKRNNLSLVYEPAMKQLNTSTKTPPESVIATAAAYTIISEMYSTSVGETLLTGYSLHELPTETISGSEYCDDNISVVRSYSRSQKRKRSVV